VHSKPLTKKQRKAAIKQREKEDMERDYSAKVGKGVGCRVKRVKRSNRVKPIVPPPKKVLDYQQIETRQHQQEVNNGTYLSPAQKRASFVQTIGGKSFTTR
jgi:hypothetical protein